ncbi:MAG: hypothetical protein U0X86_001379 [Wolbachia endosymbiont of Xenopsylla cheopis]
MYFEDQCINYNEEGYVTLPINNYFHYAKNEDLYEISLTSYNDLNLRDIIDNLNKDDSIDFTQELNTICYNDDCLQKVTFQGKKEDLEKMFINLRVYPSHKENSDISVKFKYLVENPNIVGNVHLVRFNFNCNTSLK